MIIMNKSTLAFVALASLIVVGCATQQQPPPVLSGNYLEPTEHDEQTATIRGVLTEHLLNTNRARLEGIDGHYGPEGPREPLPVKFTPGRHTLALVCEWEKTSGEAYARLDVDLMAGHHYVVACDEIGGIINAGTEFRFIDESAPSQVIAKTLSWGPNRGPKTSF